MSRRLLGAIAIVALVQGAGQGQGERVGPAWPDVFVKMSPMYRVTYDRPIVAVGEKPEVYSQKATYDWTGGRLEAIYITLARDPAFKDKYSSEAIMKQKNAPMPLDINKKKAWLWTYGPEDKSKVGKRLVVVLEDDKVIIIEQLGFGASLEKLAGEFDFAKVAKALAKAPETAK
jgi:hypothetical protein